MTTSDASEAPSSETTSVQPPEQLGKRSLKPAVLLWMGALAFGVLAYVGVTNDDVSPTILGELLFGFIAALLFVFGLYVFVKRIRGA